MDDFKYPGPWIIKKAMMQRMGVDEPVVFDVGAHRGNVSALYRRMWPEALIFAFEPVSEMIEELRQRFADDPLTTVIPKAVAQRSGTRRMYLGGAHYEMSSLLERPRDHRRYYRHELDDQRLVEATTINAFCDEYGIAHIDVMKIDVQGGEGRVLEGASRLLDEERIGLIYAEVFFVPMYWMAPLFWQLCQALDTYGMTLHSLYGIGTSKVTFQTKYADALFISDEIRSRVVDALPEEWLTKNHRSLTEGV